MTLLYFNRSKPVFYILITGLAYILINYLKNFYGNDYVASASYINLCFFLPLNLGIFYFLPNRKLLSRLNVYLLLALFAQFSLAEFLVRHEIKINLTIPDAYFGNITALGFILFTLLAVIFIFKASEKGRILDYALFFATLNTALALIYSENATAVTLFFSLAALTLLIAIIEDIYYNTYKDVLTGLAGRYAFMINSARFPLKYSLGLIIIDDYDKLLNIFGRRDRDNLIRMIAGKITEHEAEENIYRYNEEEFIIIYKNENKNESFEHLEKIRRSVASAEFILNSRKKAVKMTISTCSSEKKRSDAGSMEVLFRARKVLQKANEFSHNISHKA